MLMGICSAVILTMGIVGDWQEWPLGGASFGPDSVAVHGGTTAIHHGREWRLV